MLHAADILRGRASDEADRCSDAFILVWEGYRLLTANEDVEWPAPQQAHPLWFTQEGKIRRDVANIRTNCTAEYKCPWRREDPASAQDAEYERVSSKLIVHK